MCNNDLHQMDQTNRLCTIIGLVFDCITGIITIVIGIVIHNFTTLIPYSADWDMDLSEYNSIVSLFNTFGFIYTIITVFVVAVILVNVFLFVSLLRGKFTERIAKKIYLYQAIYGGFALSSNQLVALLYLLSGIRGYKGEREETNIRSGI